MFILDNCGGSYIEGFQDTYIWTFYKFDTVKGYVTIKWCGTFNGCCSEKVCFKEVEIRVCGRREVV